MKVILYSLFNFTAQHSFNGMLVFFRKIGKRYRECAEKPENNRDETIKSSLSTSNCQLLYNWANFKGINRLDIRNRVTNS